MRVAEYLRVAHLEKGDAGRGIVIPSTTIRRLCSVGRPRVSRSVHALSYSRIIQAVSRSERDRRMRLFAMSILRGTNVSRSERKLSRSAINNAA